MARVLMWLLFWPFLLIHRIWLKLWLWTRGYNVLNVELEGSLADAPDRALLQRLLSDKPQVSWIELLKAFARARRDPRIRVVNVQMRQLQCGLGKAEEVSRELAALSAAGKRVIVNLEDAGLTEYWAALGASEIRLCPAGSLRVMGVASELVFLKGLFEKVGVEPELEALGEYKTARETFSEKHPSAANLEMTGALVDDLYEQLVERIAQARNLGPERVKELLDGGPFLADEAAQHTLVDRLAYPNEVERELEAEWGRRYRPIDVERYLSRSRHLVRGKRPRIAVISVEGHIKQGKSSPSRTGAAATGNESFCEVVSKVQENPAVRAVVLRVNSPGGSALASELMWHQLQGLSNEKPMIVSMASVAASGGYFVSGLEGVRILANAPALTGSIGVLGGKVSAPELYKKLGINKHLIKRGQHADYTSDYVPLSESARAKLKSDISKTYHSFVEKMAKGRGRSFDELDEVARGRVFTGRQALSRGLVDELGGLSEALAWASRQAGGGARSEPRIEVHSPPSAGPLLRRLLTAVSPRSWGPPEAWGPHGMGGELVQLWSHAGYGLRLMLDLKSERLLALLPFKIRFF